MAELYDYGAWDPLIMTCWVQSAPYCRTMLCPANARYIHNQLSSCISDSPPSVTYILNRMSTLRNAFLQYLNNSHRQLNGAEITPTWPHFRFMGYIYTNVGISLKERYQLQDEGVSTAPEHHRHPWPYVHFSRKHVRRFLQYWKELSSGHEDVDIALARKVARRLGLHTRAAKPAYNPVQVLEKMAEFLHLYHRHMVEANTAGIWDMTLASSKWEWFERMHDIFCDMMTATRATYAVVKRTADESTWCASDEVALLLRRWLVHFDTYGRVVDLPLATRICWDMNEWKMGTKPLRTVEVLSKMAEMMKQYSIELRKLKNEGVIDLNEASKRWRWFKHMHDIFGGLVSVDQHAKRPVHVA